MQQNRPEAPDWDTFRNACKNVHPSLLKLYVDGFIEKMSASTSGLEEQKARILQLDALVKDCERQVRKKTADSFQKLISPECALHRDLPNAAEAIVSRDFSSLLPQESILSEELLLQVSSILTAFYEKQISDIASLYTIAKARNEKIQEADFFQKEFLGLIAPIKLFKDLSVSDAHFNELLQPLVIAKQNIQKAHPEDIQKLLDERYSLYKSIFDQVGEISKTLRSQYVGLELGCLDAKRTIRRRLFEVFTGISPYKDLVPIFSELRRALNEKLQKLVYSFYHGQASVDECSSSCQDMAYEHDVVMVRNEISHRSSRLKDLRDESYRLLKELQYTRRLLELDASVIQEKLYRDLLQLMRLLQTLIADIENPFSAFKGASNKDEVNYVFRNFWMKIEELQPKIQALIEQARTRIQGKIHLVKEAFFKAADTVEDVMKGDDGVRPVIVAQLQKDIVALAPDALLQALEAEINKLEERYSSIQPFSFYMAISDSQLRKKLMVQAKELEERMQDLRTFAKAMQYMKTFEEERVDVILEAFERAYLIEEEQSSPAYQEIAFIHYHKRMMASFVLVLEEVLLDIGLLDLHALMDVDQERLKKIIRFAIAKARKLVNELTGQLQALEEADSHSELYKIGLQYLRDTLTRWSGKEISKEESVKTHLEHLRVFCHELFDVKVLLARAQKNRIASCLEMIFQLWMLSLRVERYIEQVRGKGSAWGTPWVRESHEIRYTIISFEPDMYTADEFRSLIAKVFQQIYKIQEINALKNKGEDPLSLGKIENELLAELSQLEAYAKNTQVEMPFFYLPGFLRFFVNE